MSTVFGEDARLYDRVRAGYPPPLAGLVLAHAGAGPASAAEVGAGTGKGTALFAGRGFPITCIEPDARMSELLRARFPEAAVVTSAFEDWAPPVGGVGLLFAVMSWHWVDPARRAALAAAALAPGGTLALIGRRSQHREPDVAREIQDAFRTYGPETGDRPPLPEWSVPELRAEPAFTDVAVEELAEDVELTTGAFLDQLQTVSPFRRRTPENQRNLLADLRTRIDARGGTLHLRSVTSLVLARRRPAQPANTFVKAARVGASGPRSSTANTTSSNPGPSRNAAANASATVAGSLPNTPPPRRPGPGGGAGGRWPPRGSGRPGGPAAQNSRHLGQKLGLVARDGRPVGGGGGQGRDRVRLVQQSGLVVPEDRHRGRVDDAVAVGQFGVGAVVGVEVAGRAQARVQRRAAGQALLLRLCAVEEPAARVARRREDQPGHLTAEAPRRLQRRLAGHRHDGARIHTRPLRERCIGEIQAGAGHGGGHTR